MKFKSEKLKDRMLDYAVAISEGYVWVKNASHRSGDSYRRSNEQELWPVGSRSLVAPSKAKNLHSTEKNWDGWLACDMTEPLSPNAMYDVPKFSTSPIHAWPIIEREDISTVAYTTDSANGKKLWQAGFLAKHGNGMEGPTSIIAAMREHVFTVLGETVEIPDDVVELLK